MSAVLMSSIKLALYGQPNGKFLIYLDCVLVTFKLPRNNSALTMHKIQVKSVLKQLLNSKTVIFLQTQSLIGNI